MGIKLERLQILIEVELSWHELMMNAVTVHRPLHYGIPQHRSIRRLMTVVSLPQIDFARAVSVVTIPSVPQGRVYSIRSRVHVPSQCGLAWTLHPLTPYSMSEAYFRLGLRLPSQAVQTVTSTVSDAVYWFSYGRKKSVSSRDLTPISLRLLKCPTVDSSDSS